ncbi:Methyl-CpG-binding domain-containing protein 9 [Forsythia ovata]|uniref:Methyl-CpG-binding domain-containing protein 9 n=1 Tax=Forsythia ovata TaxID=205694 RepID=A0ABD1WI64_9LAMI
MIILENTSKSDYLRRDWWYWSTPSTAAKITTLSALALRIYALDSAISYGKPVSDRATETWNPDSALDNEAPQDSSSTNLVNSTSPPVRKGPESDPVKNPRSRKRTNKQRKEGIAHHCVRAPSQILSRIQELEREQTNRGKKDWWYWSSPSTTAKITTLSALALRIYALDSAISYGKPVSGGATETWNPDSTLDNEAPQHLSPMNLVNSTSPPVHKSPESDRVKNPRSRTRTSKQRKDLVEIEHPHFTILTIIQAMIILEDTIEINYLRRDWWYWSTTSTAAKITTLSALALCIYALDSVISYERPVPSGAT